jgi:hypothetical protein
VVPFAGKEEVASPLGFLGFPETGAEVSNLEEVLLKSTASTHWKSSSPFFFGSGLLFFASARHQDRGSRYFTREN